MTAHATRSSCSTAWYLSATQQKKIFVVLLLEFLYREMGEVAVAAVPV